jgi:nucleotide-binding universal stress UspA family protein
MKIILAPIDLSGVSEAVLREAGRLARSMGARVYLLSVVPPPTAIAEDRAMLADLAEMMIASEKNAARKLASAQDQLQAMGLTVDTVQLVGSPIEHILAEAERTWADYIVMGSHGHTALYDLLVGSTTHGVVMRARCPVIIVPVIDRRKAKLSAVDRFAAVAHIG